MSVEPITFVLMIARSGNLVAGDRAGLPASRAAKLIADQVAVEQIVGVHVDADNQPLPGFENAEEATDAAAISNDSKPWTFDPKTDPFTTDGLSRQASLALHKQGLHTVAAVRNFLASLPEEIDPVKAVGDIEDISDVQAEKLVKLYSLATEHST